MVVRVKEYSMSVLVIGADQISQITQLLRTLGATTINHWDARKKSSAPKKKIPKNTDCIIMLTSFLNHNVMHKYKNEAKKLNIPFMCSKRSIACVEEEYIKLMGIKGCEECNLNCDKRNNIKA